MEKSSLEHKKILDPCAKCGCKSGKQPMWSCIGCGDYWICLTCAYKMSPTNLFTADLTRSIEDRFENFLDNNNAKPIKDGIPWKMLCPECIEFINNRRFNSLKDEKDKDDVVETPMLLNL